MRKLVSLVSGPATLTFPIANLSVYMHVHDKSAATQTAVACFVLKALPHHTCISPACSHGGSVCAATPQASKPSGCLEEYTAAQQERLLESGKQMLRAQGIKLIKAAGHNPVLTSYSNDGTPLRVVHAIKIESSASTESTWKRGKQVLEVLVQTLFVRYIDAGGEVHSAVILADPVPLTHGKGGEAVWATSTNHLLLASIASLMDEYEEPTDFKDLMDRGNEKVRKLGNVVRGLVPKL